MPHHEESDRIERALAHCAQAQRPFRGVVYRATRMRYANRRDLLSGEGSRLHGGRWNPPGSCDAVYAALDAESAFHELLHSYRAYGVPLVSATPLVLVAIRVNLQEVLDLTDGRLRQRIHVSRQDLLEGDWLKTQESGAEALSQCMGRIACALGCEGLVVPTRRTTPNLVVFPGNLKSGSVLAIENKERLPAP